jgi:hypothetical protein
MSISKSSEYNATIHELMQESTGCGILDISAIQFILPGFKGRPQMLKNAGFETEFDLLR